MTSSGDNYCHDCIDRFRLTVLNIRMTNYRAHSNRLRSSAFSFLLIFALGQAALAKIVVNDVTQINPIIMNKVITPTTIEEVQSALANHKGKISIGGGRYSMGGQTAIENGLQIDMRKMNRVVSIDVENKKITVQAGIRWRDIHDAIDPHNLSVKIMQTYSNFTVGGSLSVNVHGRYIGQGPLIRSVDSIKVVLADGSLIEATPNVHSDIFFGAIGGYGGIGVIVEATLQLAENVKVERISRIVPASEYRKYFFSEIRNNEKVVFHNGDIYPPEFKEVNAVSWIQSEKELTVKDRLIPRNQKYTFQTTGISVLTSIPFGRKVRESVVDPLLFNKEMVVWRNHEASYDVAELEPASRKRSTFVLQEYFVPVDRFDDFVPKMRRVFKKYDVNVFNVSIRHALPDLGSLLSWAREEVFAFVVYYKQGVNPEDRLIVGNWTREMISEVLTVGGSYYLHYQIHATDDQFHRAYPRYQEYFDLKKKVDPDYKLTNKLWDRYYVAISDDILSEINLLKKYKRGEEQSYLGLPEWYIVFNGDEYAAYLEKNNPSGFPYWQSSKEFWHLKSQVKDIIKDKYPTNMGYEVMLWVIGSSYSIELLIKGLYENTIGRATEALTSAAGTDEDRLIQKFHQQYADFVHVYPWYEFSFFMRLKEFWAESSLVGENMIRKWERKLFFSIEYLAKSLYSLLIKFGTQLSYEPEATEIYAVIEDHHDQLKAFSNIKIIKSSGAINLVLMPRYDDFRKLANQFSQTNLKFVEIAGNRKIFLTAIADKSADFTFDSGDVVGLSNVPTDSNKERLLISTSVASLTDILSTLQLRKINVEHIFDY